MTNMVRFLFLVAASVHWRVITGGLNWCDKSTYEKIPEKAELAKRIHHVHRSDEFKDACYFYVTGATDECNVFDGKDSFYFNLTLARSICASFGATLPTVSNKAEMKFIHTFAYHSYGCLVVLGMTKRPVQAKVEAWDDGLDPGSYNPEKWVGAAVVFNDLTVVETKAPALEWRSVSFVNKYTLHVICKQSLAGSGSAAGRRSLSEEPSEAEEKGEDKA